MKDIYYGEGRRREQMGKGERNYERRRKRGGKRSG